MSGALAILSGFNVSRQCIVHAACSYMKKSDEQHSPTTVCWCGLRRRNITDITHRASPYEAYSRLLVLLNETVYKS